MFIILRNPQKTAMVSGVPSLNIVIIIIILLLLIIVLLLLLLLRSKSLHKLNLIIKIILVSFFFFQESLSGMTNGQFSGIIDRLTTFTSQNLKKLISHMNLDAFFANVDKVAVS